MSTPKRVQRTRKKGGGIKKGAVYVGRPGIFGNPFKANGYMAHWYETKNPAEMVTIAFRRWLYRTDHLNFTQDTRSKILTSITKLRGKDLACWCPIPKSGQPDHCHAAVLLKLANPELKDD